MTTFPKSRDPHPRRVEDAALRTAASNAVNETIRRFAFWVFLAAVTGTASGAIIGTRWVDQMMHRQDTVEQQQDSVEARLTRHIVADSSDRAALRQGMELTRQDIAELRIILQERLPRLTHTASVP